MDYATNPAPKREGFVTDTQLRFEEIHDQFRSKILRYLAHMVGENDAEDLTQEVFVKVSRALPTFRGESSVSTWLYKIATNTALDKLRNKSFRPVRQDGPLVTLDSLDWNEKAALPGVGESSTEQQAIRGEVNACIRGVIDRLPENYKTPIVLSDIEGLDDKEVAKILGLSLRAAKMRLHRARERLRKELSEYCVFYRNEQNEFVCDIKQPAESRIPK
jgi:RNA polymerase sigma-70 factor (ECF subfamily)